MAEIERGEIILKGRLSGDQRNRLAKLLDMMYRPSELAEEVGFNTRQVYRVYIPLGMPHKRDVIGRIFINGVAFRKWVREIYKKQPLKRNEIFCLTCKRPVEMVNPTKHSDERIIYYLSDCPNCGRTCSRIISKKRRGHD